MDNHLIAAVRQNHPITFTVANTVTSGKVADALSAIGASPIMSTALEEAADLVAAAHAITLNIGTPTAELCKELTAVAAAANRLHKPLVLDPVACGATAFRQQINHDLLTSHQFTVIRGNAGEIASLVGVDWDGHGIDAGSGDGDLVTLAERCASRYQTTVVLSGPVDVITNGQATRHNDRGTEWLATNVGSGDILSSIIAALLGQGVDPMTAGWLGCRLVTTAGKNATKGTHGLGSWQEHFLDELTMITDEDLA